MLSQKLYSEAANQALDRSLQAFAQATGTTVRNDLVSGDAGDMVAKMDAEIKAGTNRDMAFMSDRRFVGQLHNLGNLTDVTDVVEEMRKLYGEPASEASNYCVFDGRWFAIPYHFIGDGDVPAQGLVRGEGPAAEAALHVGGAARQRAGRLRPGETALRLGPHREPLRRRERLHHERHQHLRRGDRGQHRQEGGVQLAGDRRGRLVHRRHLHEPEVQADAPARDRQLDRLEQQRELAGPDPRAHPQPVQRLRRLEDQEQPGLREHAPVQRGHRAGDRQAARVRRVELVRRVQGGEEPRPRQAGGEVHGQRERAARRREGRPVPGQPVMGQGVGLRPLLHQR